MAEPAPLDIFRRVLAGAARAIARDPEIEVAFASDAGAATGKVARVPSPGPGLERRLVAEARGGADALALKLRHHDAKLHAAYSPADAEAAAVFDALETARGEAPLHAPGARKEVRLFEVATGTPKPQRPLP